MEVGRFPRAAMLVVAMLLSVTGLDVFGAPHAGAGGEDPYGSTSTTTEPELEVSCRLEAASGVQSTAVEGSLEGWASGEVVSVFLGSTLVDRVTVDADGNGDIQFNVPTLPPGEYQASASSVSGTAECQVPGGGTLFEVLADADDSGDGGGLAFTGTSVLVLALVALALIAAGWLLRRSSTART